MPPDQTPECEFYIPKNRDKNLSDGQPHPTEAWEWLDNELDTEFQAGTMAPGLYRGFYRDPDTHERVDDESYKFIVAIPASALPRLRGLLMRACNVFQQKCIYLSVAGQVEFVWGDDHETNGSIH